MPSIDDLAAATDDDPFMCWAASPPAPTSAVGGGRRRCALSGELPAGRDRVALLADYWNVAAVATYRKSGFCLQPLAAAHRVTG